jgi:hypothetical protein
VSVLLPNTDLGLRRRTEGVRNAHGERVGGDWAPVGEFYPGRTNERADGGWALGVDPSLWPVRKDDLIVDRDGTEWLVETSDLIRNNYDSRVDWVRVTGYQRTGTGTEPGGAEFVGR